MTDQPQSWHYGLVARWWAEFNEANPDELAFYQRIIEDHGQPALDLACGAGRILLPLLRAGLDVDGADISPDMLAGCRELAAREGPAPRLYQQAMHALAIPREYRTIFICDSFGIGGSREQDMETLRRCHRQLAPGGRLAFSHYLPYDNATEWENWIPERRQTLPEPWPETDLRKQTGDGDEIALSSRLVDIDPLAQWHKRQIRTRLWRGGAMMLEEERFLSENLYFRNELVLMLSIAGFSDVEVHAGYTGRAAAAEDTYLVFVARKPLP